MTDRRAPIIAAVASVALSVLLLFFLVLPKRHQVSAAKEQLQEAQNQEATLVSQRNALLSDKEAAPIAKSTIAKVQQQIPPTLDESGVINLLQSSLNKSTVSWLTATFGTPASSGNFSIVPVSLSIGGTYFQLAEFMYQIETFPRAAKVTSISVTASEEAFPMLSMQVTLELYTSDVSAGPGSEPGETVSANEQPVTVPSDTPTPTPTLSPGS
jgi:Tfp pilus assembly protein PilO